MTEKKSSREKQHGGRGTTASLFKEKKMKYLLTLKKYFFKTFVTKEQKVSINI